MKKLSKRSLKNIKGIDERLILILGMLLARGKVDLTIICGMRTLEEQQEAFKNEFSKLDGINKKSKHQEGLAFDFIPFPFKGWGDREGFRRVGEELKLVAKHLGFECQYGGDWGWDWGHFELK